MLEPICLLQLYYFVNPNLRYRGRTVPMARKIAKIGTKNGTGFWQGFNHISTGRKPSKSGSLSNLVRLTRLELAQL